MLLQCFCFGIKITHEGWYTIKNKDYFYRPCPRDLKCDTMGGVRICLCECRSGNPFVCFGTRPTQRVWGEISRETGSGWGKEGPREDRERLLKKEGKRDHSAWESSQEKEKGIQSTDVSMAGGFCGSFVRVNARVSLQNAQKVSPRLLSSCAWSWPKPVFVLLFFSSNLSDVFCVSVKKCVMPLVGNKRNH